ncbi:hypothetical protein WAI453_007260 [Rhynchosporium graminicola]
MFIAFVQMLWISSTVVAFEKLGGCRAVDFVSGKVDYSSPTTIELPTVAGYVPLHTRS